MKLFVILVLIAQSPAATSGFPDVEHTRGFYEPAAERYHHARVTKQLVWPGPDAGDLIGRVRMGWRIHHLSCEVANSLFQQPANYKSDLSTDIPVLAH